MGRREDPLVAQGQQDREEQAPQGRLRLQERQPHRRQGQHRQDDTTSTSGGGSSNGGLDPQFQYCYQAQAAGYGPYYRGKDPEYYWYTDADNDGVVCE